MTNSPGEAALPDELPEEDAPDVGPDDNTSEGGSGAPSVPDPDEDQLPG